jgi:hypothetical protein
LKKIGSIYGREIQEICRQLTIVYNSSRISYLQIKKIYKNALLAKNYNKVLFPKEELMIQPLVNQLRDKLK